MQIDLDGSIIQGTKSSNFYSKHKYPTFDLQLDRKSYVEGLLENC